MTDFLRDVLQDDIQLVSIIPDVKSTRGKYFGADAAAAWAWAKAENARGANIYYTVNRPLPLDKKPLKSEITGIRFAHVDIDPPGVPSEWDKASALANLLAMGAPSVVVDTGNGLQALWRLTNSPSDVEQINRGITYAFGADDCHNLDRIFRLPGTINYPSRTKQARGYVETEASLLWAEPVTYDPEALRGHWPAPPTDMSARGAEEAEIGAWEVLDLDDLQPPVTPALRHLIETDPGVGNRSNHATSVASRMGMAGYSNEVIMGIMMNPEFPWSGTILDQKDPERQARRKVKFGEAARPNAEAVFQREAEVPEAALPEPPMLTAARESGCTPHNGGILMPDQQLLLFAGCVFISGQNKIFTPNGRRVEKAVFDVLKGGYEFLIGDPEGKKKTDSAWVAFTQNYRYRPPTVDEVCFRPELEPRAIVQDGTLTLLNGYVPIDTPVLEGDPEPFLTHMEKLLPDERDRQILLTFMASCIQNVGFKAQWAPVVQGVQGNGKTLLLDVMAYAVGRQYYHTPNAAKMTRKGVDFNAWVENKLFFGMEEVYSSNRRDFLNEFKPYVTNRTLPIEGKGVNEYTGDNRANMILLTNYRDGVPIDANERRYAPLFTAQQSRADMARDGMTSAYFVNLWDWLRGEGRHADKGVNYGYKVVNGHLRSYQCVAEFDPRRLATVAPLTSCFSEAVNEGRGQAEQEVQEAIDQGLPGFAGGWVSSIMLDRLLEAKRLMVPRGKRKALMESLGYHYHPALEGGRVHNAVTPDNGKPRLYVKVGTIADQNVTKPADAARMYQDAQQQSSADVASATLAR